MFIIYIMSEARNQQIETAVLMDDIAFGVNLEVPYMDEEPSAGTRNSSGELTASESCESCCLGENKSVTVPHVAGNLTNTIDGFIPGLQEYFKNMLGKELPANKEESLRQLLPLWNTFLQSKQGIRDTSAIISSDIKENINEFVLWQEERTGKKKTEHYKTVISGWLPQWNMFLQARAGKPVVTCLNYYLTIMGFIFYIVDIGSDIGTSIYYASNGQLWRAMLTLTIVYGAVIIHTGIKWINEDIRCTGSADWLRYIASLLVNWPDVKQYWTLCLLELQMYKSPVNSAHRVPEWHQRRVNVTYLKYMEGVWEACPQAILQLYLLVPDLYGDWTWTNYLRIASASVSLCTAGAALVNEDKYIRIGYYIDMPLSELLLLHVWAVPVTVSRLLSVTLLLSVHPYWTLAGVALHLVLRGVYWCRSQGVPRVLAGVLAICLDTLQFFISPFGVNGSISSRRVRHALHFLINTTAKLVWALDTPLVCRHPALHTAIICFNAVIFAVGLLSWQLHEKYWRS